MHRTVSAVALATLMATAHAQTRQAPLPHCIDSRAIAEAHQVDARTLALRDEDGGRRRVTLAEACPDLLGDLDVALIGWGGWLCGTEGDAIRTAESVCPVARVEHVDARAYAELVRESRQNLMLLAPVVVRGPRARGFRGTPDYCVASRWLRSWHEDSDGLVVEVSPRRSAGNRYYRVEIDGGCSQIVNSDTIALVSGLGTGIVCGHPGDHVVFSKSVSARGTGSGSVGLPALGQTALASASRCRVSNVYPLER